MRQIRLIGVPTDVNSSFRRGAAAAAAHIRREIWSDCGNAATELGGELGLDIDLVDAGDLALAETAADDAIITAATQAAAQDGAVPILLGGDHAISFPAVAGLAAIHGPLNILHIDAHPDLYDALDGNKRSHASPFARIMEAGLATRLVQIGIRTLNAHCREQVARFGVEVVPMRGFHPAQVPLPAAPLYISIDMDGFDPAHAPGVAHPEPGGLTPREVLDVLARLPGPIIGADVVELNPGLDVNGLTARLAAKLVKELAALASR